MNGRKRVLLVADNPSGADLIRVFLDDSFQLDHAERVSVAVQRLQQTRYDAVVLDLTLTHSQELESLHGIRQSGCEAPIVIHSGHADDALALEAIQNGAQDYLFKERMTPDSLQRAVNYAIDRARYQLEILQAREALEEGVQNRMNAQRKANERLQEEIEARKRMEEEVRRLEEGLRRVTRVYMLNELAAAIALELNQPLTAIAAFASSSIEGVLSNTWSPRQLVETLEKIAAQAMWADELINRGLILEHQTEFSTSDLNEATRDAIALIDSEARDCDINLRLELVPHLPPVAIDRVQIQQVLLNLVRNAIEAMVAAESTSRTVIVASRLIDAARVEVQVTDSGPGCRDDELAKLFEPFFSTKRDGFGLGLVVSQKIIEAHGGKLSANRNTEGGLTIHFSLPVASIQPQSGGKSVAPNSRRAATCAAPPHRVKGPTVYVLDDNPAVCESITCMLESAGLAVNVSRTSEELLLALTPDCQGCLLCDDRIPDIDGIQLLKVLAERQIRIPVILMSGQARLSSAVDGLKAGAIDYLKKPFTQSDLLPTVFRAMALDARRHEQEAASQLAKSRIERLTAREREVLAGLLDGKTIKQIAAKLGTSPHTVRNQRKSILCKLEAVTDADLVRFMLAGEEHHADARPTRVS